ncbi:hypothetical protein Syun_018462 [Stephania yunnanensis]|uniref:G domain-containing protein n=2 Tax=Stephania yunnanensis TaxID=152371 RepID=A0AAP0ISY7_9MAGN
MELLTFFYVSDLQFHNRCGDTSKDAPRDECLRGTEIKNDVLFIHSYANPSFIVSSIGLFNGVGVQIGFQRLFFGPKSAGFEVSSQFGRWRHIMHIKCLAKWQKDHYFESHCIPSVVNALSHLAAADSESNSTYVVVPKSGYKFLQSGLSHYFIKIVYPTSFNCLFFPLFEQTVNNHLRIVKLFLCDVSICSFFLLATLYLLGSLKQTHSADVISNIQDADIILTTPELQHPGDLLPLPNISHHLLARVVGGRCRSWCWGRGIVVGWGVGGDGNGNIFISVEKLKFLSLILRHFPILLERLSNSPSSTSLLYSFTIAAITLLSVDIVDFNGSFLARIRDLAGANPIILVVTKIDLLPKGTDLNCVGDWVVEATTKKNLSNLSPSISSQGIKEGFPSFIDEKPTLLGNSHPFYACSGRDVYILGSANVGKSAFINALLKTMAQKDPVAAAARKYKPIQSAVPGTTLGPIQIDAFFGGGKLFDTPGVHLHHRQAAVIHSEDLPALAPQSRLQGKSFPVASIENVPNKKEANKLDGFSLFWGGLVRVDVLKVLPSTRLTFYGPNKIKIHMIPVAEADEFYQKEIGVTLMPPSGKDRAKDRPGLQTIRQVQIKYDNQKSPACDIAISGLGWISVNQMIKQTEDSDSLSLEKVSGELHLAVHVPKQVEIFVRSSMAVGKAGAEWYEYKDLTEKEEELRPKWYF